MYWECYYTTNDTIYWSLMVIMDCNDTYTHLIYIHHICVWLRLIGCRSNDRWYGAKTSRLTIQRHGNDGQLMAQYYICSYVDNTYVFVMSIQNIPSILILLLIMNTHSCNIVDHRNRFCVYCQSLNIRWVHSWFELHLPCLHGIEFDWAMTNSMHAVNIITLFHTCHSCRFSSRCMEENKRKGITEIGEFWACNWNTHGFTSLIFIKLYSILSI